MCWHNWVFDFIDFKISLTCPSNIPSKRLVVLILIKMSQYGLSILDTWVVEIYLKCLSAGISRNLSLLLRVVRIWFDNITKSYEMVDEDWHNYWTIDWRAMTADELSWELRHFFNQSFPYSITASLVHTYYTISIIILCVLTILLNSNVSMLLQKSTAFVFKKSCKYCILVFATIIVSCNVVKHTYWLVPS